MVVRGVACPTFALVEEVAGGAVRHAAVDGPRGLGEACDRATALAFAVEGGREPAGEGFGGAGSSTAVVVLASGQRRPEVKGGDDLATSGRHDSRAHLMACRRRSPWWPRIRSRSLARHVLKPKEIHIVPYIYLIPQYDTKRIPQSTSPPYPFICAGALQLEDLGGLHRRRLERRRRRPVSQRADDRQRTVADEGSQPAQV
jgi:hypothetical protein